jgi:L-2-hydroxyglutarate oxidase LhgO
MRTDAVFTLCLHFIGFLKNLQERSPAVLPSFCQEHLAVGEAGYLAATAVVMDAFESASEMNTVEVHLNSPLKNLERKSENKSWKSFYH